LLHNPLLFKDHAQTAISDISDGHGFVLADAVVSREIAGHRISPEVLFPGSSKELPKADRRIAACKKRAKL
jgi:hypothetical protein